MPSGARVISPPAPERFASRSQEGFELALGDEALRRVLEYFRVVKRFLRLARRYWFDALIFVGLALGLFGAVVSQDESDGPTGPLWFDLLAVTAIVTPLFFRRRFPFGAPIAVGVAVGLTAFVDERLVPKDFIPFVAGCAAVFLV